jgi:hypothetical protein
MQWIVENFGMVLIGGLVLIVVAIGIAVWLEKRKPWQ